MPHFDIPIGILINRRDQTTVKWEIAEFHSTFATKGSFKFHRDYRFCDIAKKKKKQTNKD